MQAQHKVYTRSYKWGSTGIENNTTQYGRSRLIDGLCQTTDVHGARCVYAQTPLKPRDRLCVWRPRWRAESRGRVESKRWGGHCAVRSPEESSSTVRATVTEMSQVTPELKNYRGK